MCSTRTPEFLFMGLLCSPSSLSLYTDSGLPQPWCRIQRLLFLNVMWLVIAGPLILSGHICKPFYPQSSQQLLLMQRHPQTYLVCIHLLCSDDLHICIQSSKRTGPKMEPFRTPLLTGHQPDVAPFTLWAQPASQLITHCIMYLSRWILDV